MDRQKTREAPCFLYGWIAVITVVILWIAIVVYWLSVRIDISKSWVKRIGVSSVIELIIIWWRCYVVWWAVWTKVSVALWKMGVVFCRVFKGVDIFC